MFKFFLIIFQFIFFIKIVEPTFLSNKEELFIVNCLNQKRNSSGLDQSDLSQLDQRKCSRYQYLYHNTENNSNTKLKVNEENDILIYLKSLLKWRKNSQKLHGLLNKVSSCHLYSKNLRKYWLNFFRKRQGTFFTSVATFDQSWSSGRGIIRAKSSSLPYSPENIVAAELVLSKTSHDLQEEQYDRYETLVSASSNIFNKTMVHKNMQSSCSSRDRNLVLLELDSTFVSKWHRTQSSILTLNVEVKRLRQHKIHSDKKMDDVHRIEGLVIHFRRSNEEKIVDEQQSRAMLFNSSYLFRKYFSQSYRGFREPGFKSLKSFRSNHKFKSIVKRSARRSSNRASRGVVVNIPRRRLTARKCSLVSFRLPRSLMRKALNITWTSTGNNIKECFGECGRPVPDHVSITNHAIALNYHSPENVCCVPTQYEPLTYLSHKNDEIVYRELTDFIATACGCR